MLNLRWTTPAEWVEVVGEDLIAFLQDHAANERKVSQSALGLAVEHPRRTELVDALIDVAQEELAHFVEVHGLLRARGATLAPDGPHPYIGQLRRAAKSADAAIYLRDRLLVFGLIEARACERFGLLADGLDDPELRRFYAEFQRAEARHHGLYVQLARRLFDPSEVDARSDALLDIEAQVASEQPLRPALF